MYKCGPPCFSVTNQLKKLLTETYFRDSARLLGYCRVHLNSPDCQNISVINSSTGLKVFTLSFSGLVELPFNRRRTEASKTAVLWVPGIGEVADMCRLYFHMTPM